MTSQNFRMWFPGFIFVINSLHFDKNRTMDSPDIIKEPIQRFYDLAGFDPAVIARWEIGEKYVGLMLNNGNIGVCAILGQEVDDSILQSGVPDLNNPGHRIILHAWFNALLNYNMREVHNGDIFDPGRFSLYGKIVMIGSFGSLLEKFSSAGIAVDVFDRLSEEEFLIPMRKQPEFLASADCVILTGTTVSNNTFTEIIGHTPEKCDIFLLGPSNIIHQAMFGYRNIRVVFGSRFRKGDAEVLDLIRDGHGTKGFLKNLNKVYISSK